MKKIMDRLSRVLGSHAQPKGKTDRHILGPVDIQLIAGGSLERLADFAASSRLNSVDLKGDTPLHHAARMGNLAVCELFIQSGANPRLLNHDRQTPSEVAFAEGHGHAAQFLSSLVASSPGSGVVSEQDGAPEIATVQVGTDATTERRITVAEETEPDGTVDDLDELPRFEAEVEPEEFFRHYTGETASGTFVVPVSSAAVVFDGKDGEWDLDLSPAPIAGEGIGASAAIDADDGTENEFLKFRNRGRRSVKRAVVQTGTRLTIDPEICVIWAHEILAKGCCSHEDVDQLVALCEGNGDLEELRCNLQRTLEVAGFDLFYQTNECEAGLWDAKSTVSSDELAEAIEAALTRKTRLPGTQQFVMNKSDELQLLKPLVRANQDLQLGILASETAVETILDVVDNIGNGVRDPGSVSLRTIIPSRPGHTETAEVMSAAEALRSWQRNGRVMDGKQRREALLALEALDLSLAFRKELVCSLEREEASFDQSARLGGLISIYEAANERLLLEHLPHARRFAARNVEKGEDPEDVFQVAFTGLQRSARRFDPERGIRFVAYCNFSMKQALTRWRADEGASIRVPVHRQENLAKLDRALDKLNLRSDGMVSDNELAAELEWTANEVRWFRSIPRQAENPESIDDWDSLLTEPEKEIAFDQTETQRIVADVLAELQERQADVIRMRFGIGRDAEMTLEEIGQVYGVTRERIRQIEAKGLDRLSHPGRKRRLQKLLGI